MGWLALTDFEAGLATGLFIGGVIGVVITFCVAWVACGRGDQDKWG